MHAGVDVGVESRCLVLFFFKNKTSETFKNTGREEEGGRHEDGGEGIPREEKRRRQRVFV